MELDGYYGARFRTLLYKYYGITFGAAVQRQRRRNGVVDAFPLPSVTAADVTEKFVEHIVCQYGTSVAPAKLMYPLQGQFAC